MLTAAMILLIDDVNRDDRLLKDDDGVEESRSSNREVLFLARMMSAVNRKFSFFKIIFQSHQFPYHKIMADEFNSISNSFLSWLSSSEASLSPKIEIVDLREQHAGRGVSRYRPFRYSSQDISDNSYSYYSRHRTR